MYDQLFEAGKIHKKVALLAESFLKPGLNWVSFSEFVEKKVYDNGAGFGFPVCISVDGVAAHDTAKPNDKRIFEKENIIKIDFGVRVGDYLTDAAFTKYLGQKTELKKLSQITKTALSNAEKLIKNGSKINEIGKIMGNTITTNGFNPIQNLTGHGVSKGRVHTKPNIPCYDNGNTKRISSDLILAVEPYATLGRGFSVNDSKSELFRLTDDKKNTRSVGARKILNWIRKERQFLPFCKRWIPDFEKGGEFYLKTLINDGIVKNYPILNEIDNGLTSQTEHTYLIQEKETIRIT